MIVHPPSKPLVKADRPTSGPQDCVQEGVCDGAVVGVRSLLVKLGKPPKSAVKQPGGFTDPPPPAGLHSNLGVNFLLLSPVQ